MFRFLFIFVLFSFPLIAGDKWDYYLKTQADITWNERNQLYLDKFVPENVMQKNAGMISYLLSKAVISPLQSSKYCYSFLSHMELNPEQANALIQKIHRDLLIEIHRNKETLVYLTQDVDVKHLSPADIGVKIAFFTPRKDRMSPPHVARVYKVANKAYYNMADNTAPDQLQSSIALN